MAATAPIPTKKMPPALGLSSQAENEFRKDFTHSERVAIGEAIEVELGNRLGVNQHTEGPENFPDPAKGDTRDLAAKAAGFGNGKTY